MTFYCTWCGATVQRDDVTLPDHSSGNAVGVCPDDDGIVYVTTDPEEVGA